MSCCKRCGRELGVATVDVVPPIVVSSFGGKIIKRRRLVVQEAGECYHHRFELGWSHRPVPGLNVRRKHFNLGEFRAGVGHAPYYAIGAVASQFGIHRIMGAPEVLAMPPVLRRFIAQVCVHYAAC